jgi:hypothetical protein
MFDEVWCPVCPIVTAAWWCSEDLNFPVFVVNNHPLSKLIEGPERSDADDEIFYRRGAIMPVVIGTSQRRCDLCHRGAMEV